ncbi:MAG: hypothetical protein H7Y13_02315 [Sphingobacteriaceae bacterium]|nr:hypothetical protein [Sphingobacteriaceae bacterium]
MSTASTSNKIAILGLIAGLGLVIFFFWKKVRAKALNLPAALPIVGQNVAQKIEIGYSKDMVTFSEFEVKKYAGWIDAIISEIKSLKDAAKKESTPKMLHNVDVLKSMSDANLRSVVNYWQKVRGANILKSPIFNSNEVLGFYYLDNTEKIPALLYRLQDLGFTAK